jgi:glycosyltransferase involved in cell wall biosynthesis
MSRVRDVSIVIPTFNRPQRLRLVLDALSRQTEDKARFEVIVVDDGSQLPTSEALAGVTFPFTLRIIRQDNAGPARARNRGIEEASRELVLFLDDDVEPLPELVAEHLASHAAETQDTVVIGPLSSLPHYPQPWVAWEQAKVEQQYQAMITGKMLCTFRQFWTGNASVARAHLNALGGFDTTFLRGEDVELGVRMHDRGLIFRFNPRAAGLHHAERSLDSWCHAHRSYGRLEVNIFGQLGEEEMIEVLAGNLSRLHTGTRAVLRACFKRPELYGVTGKSIRMFLTSGAATRAPGVADKACSVLANLLYWQESSNALGPERMGRLTRRADEIVARGEVVEFGGV